MSKEHKVRRFNDQYHCHVCGRQWDIDDTDPPECIDRRTTDEEAAKVRTRRRIEEIREMLQVKHDLEPYRER